MPVVRHGGNNIVPACTDTAVGAYVANQETDTQKQQESSEVTESQETTEPEETKESEEVTEPPVEETIDYAALEKAKEPYCKQEEHSYTEECYENVGTLQIQIGRAHV